MDDKDIENIKKIMVEVVGEYMENSPAPKDEAVILQASDGRRVELRSSQETLNTLLTKADMKLKQLNPSLTSPKLTGYIN